MSVEWRDILLGVIIIGCATWITVTIIWLMFRKRR